MILLDIPIHELIEKIQKMEINLEKSFGCYFTSKTINSKSYAVNVELKQNKTLYSYDIHFNINPKTVKITSFTIMPTTKETTIQINILTHKFCYSDFSQFYDYLDFLAKH